MFYTTLAPTPCNPPEILYVLESNLPPACETVKTVSKVETCVFGRISVGIPRPLSVTVTELS
jgi:hypothetical protein